MSRLVKALKVFAVSLVASIIVTGTGGYFLLDHLYTLRIIDIKQDALSMNFTRSAFAKADDAIESKMLEHEGAFYVLYEQSNNTGANLDIIATKLTEEIQSVSQNNTDSIKQFHQQLESSNNKTAMINSEIVSILHVLQQLNNELEDIKENHIQIPKAIDDVNNLISDNKYLEPCPNNIINRGAQLPILKRAVANIRAGSTGLHDVTVKFDITERGTTILKNIQSGTANNYLVNAVTRYIDSLIFENPNNTFADCEMVVKLNIT